MDYQAIKQLASEHGVGRRNVLTRSPQRGVLAPMHRGNAAVGYSDGSCSLYANKTITTGEVEWRQPTTKEVANHMRMMSLHGLSHDAWGRYSGTGTWTT